MGNKLRPCFYCSLIIIHVNRKLFLAVNIIACALVSACTRKDIEFGTIPENQYTNLVYVDTVGIQLSTVLRDSFTTGNASSFLLGRYKDPYLGTVAGKIFNELTIPTSVPEIPSTAVFDSMTLIFRPNNYYYGDTTQPQTYSVYELDQAITLGYSSSLFNTSNFPVKSTPLGSKTMRINPVGFDSVSIRLNDAKGLDLFTKLQQSATEVGSETAFLNYFKGLSIAVAESDSAAIFGIAGGSGAMVMRIHYHHTIPYPENHTIDFVSLSNDHAFYQLLSDRNGTGLTGTGTSGSTEVFPAHTFHRAYAQSGTGLHLKMTFPGLRSLLNDKTQVRLLKAELIVRPGYLSFDKSKYKLPDQLYLSLTDASNIVGTTVSDSSGTGTLYASPVIDELYGENNYYRFNVTSYIGSWLLTPGSEDDGFFVMTNNSSSVANVDRLVVNDLLGGDHVAKLLLTVLIINN